MPRPPRSPLRGIQSVLRGARRQPTNWDRAEVQEHEKRLSGGTAPAGQARPAASLRHGTSKRCCEKLYHMIAKPITQRGGGMVLRAATPGSRFWRTDPAAVHERQSVRGVGRRGTLLGRADGTPLFVGRSPRTPVPLARAGHQQPRGRENGSRSEPELRKTDSAIRRLVTCN